MQKKKGHTDAGMESRMKSRKKVSYILLGAAVFLGAVLGIQYGRQRQLQQEIAEKIVRFHVRANSDSEEDQQLKLAVRDAVGSLMGGRLAGVSDKTACEDKIEESLGEVVTVAERVIADAGYDYSVTASLEMVDFPVKTYGDYTFPAGNYEALTVNIGEGEGHNWWCVMYPNMCFAGSVYEVVDTEAEESLRQVLSEEEYSKVFSEGDYQVQFRYLTFLNELYSY